MAKEIYGVRYIPLINLLDQESVTFNQISKAFKGASRNKINIGSKALEKRFYELIEASALPEENMLRLSKFLEHCATSLSDRNREDIAENYRDLSTYLFHLGH